MKAATAIVLATVVSMAAASTETAPTYIMSPIKWMNDGSMIETEIQAQDVANMFAKKNAPLSDSLKATRRNARPANDMIIAITDETLTAGGMLSFTGAYGDDVTLPNFKKLLTESSVSIPYTVNAHSVVNMISTQLPSYKSHSSSVTSRTTCSEISSTINKVGGKSIINFHISQDAPSNLQVVDRCIPQIMAAAKKFSNKFSIVLSGASSHATMSGMNLLEDDESGAASKGRYTFGEEYLRGPEYMTGGVITVCVVSFLLLIAAIIGFNCTLAIETPVRYANPTMVLLPTKEY